jgi:hypothetical protein
MVVTERLALRGVDELPMAVDSSFVEESGLPSEAEVEVRVLLGMGLVPFILGDKLGSWLVVCGGGNVEFIEAHE